MPLPDTRPARQAIFAALRGVPAAPLPAPDLAPYHASPFGRGRTGARIDPATLCDPFEAAARGWRADVLRARLADWPGAVIPSVCAGPSCRRALRIAGEPSQ